MAPKCIKRGKRGDFLRREILEHVRLLNPSKPHVINVKAKHGDYQIVVEPSRKGRRVDITGHIHHMYMMPDGISAYPTPQEVSSNLSHTIIVKDITVHVIYPDGGRPEVAASEYINLAGEEGRDMLRQMSGHLPDAVEGLMEEDITSALRSNEDSLTY